MEGRAQYTSARWYLCPLLYPLGNFSEAQAKTLLPAELRGAAELWRVQPDTLAGRTSSHWIICARQTTHTSGLTLTSCPSLLPHPHTSSHTYLLKNSSYPSDKAVPPIPSGQAGKRAFLIMSVSSQTPLLAQEHQAVTERAVQRPCLKLVLLCWTGTREKSFWFTVGSCCSTLNPMHLICTEEQKKGL